jgi:hypothetical protein
MLQRGSDEGREVLTMLLPCPPDSSSALHIERRTMASVGEKIKDTVKGAFGKGGSGGFFVVKSFQAHQGSEQQLEVMPPAG